MGSPASRITDMHICPKVNPGPVPHVGGPIAMGSPNVLIGSLPAARQGDMAICVGPPDKISAGSSNVLINGKQAVRIGDPTVHGGKVILGFPTVLIGEDGGGGGGGGAGAAAASDSAKARKIQSQKAQAETLNQAAKDGTPFCEICEKNKNQG